MSIFICSYCYSERKNNRSLKAHESFCKSNPDRSSHDHSKAGSLGNRKSRITNAKKREDQKLTYEKNAIQCLNCNKSLPYDKRKNKFCSNSCSASYNNKSRKCKPGPNKGSPNKIKIGDSSLPRKLFNQLKPKYVLYRQLCSECKLYFWSQKKSKTCTKECRSKIYSRTAKNNPKMGGNKNTKAHGWYKSNIAGKVWLESSWEYKVAKSLDSSDIKWERPKYLKYGDKKYFPDFYLVDYNVYLDPKNPYLQKQDYQKIQQARHENNVSILLLNEDQLEWNVIERLITAP